VIAELSFYGAVAVIVWVYLGYPVVLGLVATLRRRPVQRRAVEPRVSLVICAYNEERDIRNKLEETLACDYPGDRLEVIVASDGSTDRTDDIVQEFVRRYAPRVRLLRVEGRGGKTVAQNAAVQAATGDILVFSDVTTVYAPGTIRAMVENFADPRVGCVAGDLHYEKDPRNPSAQGRALFWSYERQLRIWESQVHSIIGVAGCAYAMRRELYRPLDPGAISDFVQPGTVTERGWRTVLEPQALAYEPVESHSLG
jgi:cellulose synthase/poly-beta-1,6-N-acetylglucosamine synthase-like glycosyltransferase